MKKTALCIIAAVLTALCLMLSACGHEHKWDKGKITKQPTESEYGEITLTCQDCGEVKKEIIAKLEPRK